MLRTYRYRLYPTKDQQNTLDEILWVACWLYNRALDYRRKRWNESRKSVTYYEQAGMWRDWRNEDGDNSLRLLKLSAGQQVLRRLDNAYRQFFKGKRGKPRFQKPSHFNSVNYKPGDGASIKDQRLYVQNVGFVKIRWHRALPEGSLKNIIVVRKPSGWVDTYGAIALEDLSLKFMLQNGILSRSGHDVGLGMFCALLDYKAIEAGVEIVVVNPRNTSQACSGCGKSVLKDLSVRLHVCPTCGLTLDRDVNAARNILRLGHSRWALTWEVAPSVAQEAACL